MIQKYGFTLLGILSGGTAGYLYYHYIGCSNGTCPITSRPFTSILYGALMGWLLAQTFSK